MESVSKQCVRCNKYLPHKEFISLSMWRPVKTCSFCREKYKIKRNKSKCMHGTVKFFCKKCSGSSICKHNRVRSICKECIGGSICIHNNVRTICKECLGGSICQHNKRRHRCKRCGGGSICEHYKIRSECKLCSQHNRIITSVSNV